MFTTSRRTWHSEDEQKSQGNFRHREFSEQGWTEQLVRDLRANEVPDHAKNSPISETRDTCCTVYAKSCDNQPRGAKSGRLQPRVLVLLIGDVWIPTAKPPVDIDYVFISWHWASFSYDGAGAEASVPTKVINMAKNATLDAGLEAYWLDAQCLADSSMPSTDPASNNIHSMSDVVRTARNVAIILPDDRLESKRAWAKRLWTLSEAFLARGNLHVWVCNGSTSEKSIMSRVDIVNDFLQGCYSNSHQIAVRNMAGYYDGSVELNRLERLVTVIVALSGQESTKYTEADIAYAFMGLIPDRIEPSMTESLFTAMVKLLALTDENDGIIERVVASSHRPETNIQDLLRKLDQPDHFGTCLRDIQPACKVVGVGEEDCTLFIAGCKLIYVDWSALPNSSDERNLLAFEGIITSDEIKVKLSGKSQQRPSYKPLRESWDKRKYKTTKKMACVSPGESASSLRTNARYHFFTLVDTAMSKGYHCQARKRPIAALLCGHEGKLTRAALCSWDPEARLFTKETVVRLPQKIWDGAPLADCLKMKLL